MLITPTRKFENLFSPIGIIAGAGPEAGIDLWSKVLLASRATQGTSYLGDSCAPFVRIVSDPALGLDASGQTQIVIDQHLQNCLSEVSKTCPVFTIACNALQAKAKALVDPTGQSVFVTFDASVDAALSRLNASSFFLVGSSAVMSLSSESIYSSLRSKYSINTPKDWAGVDRLIQDIKLTGGKHPTLVKRLETLVAEGEEHPVVLACTDFPLVPANFSNRVTIDASEALAASLLRAAVRI